MLNLDEYRDIQLIHGGVFIDSKDRREYMYILKLRRNIEFKKAIAHKLIDFINDGDSIIIDSGTTCFFAAKELRNRKELRVITKDLKVAEELSKHDSTETIIIGGIVRPGYYSVGGEIALSMLDHFNIEKVILTADAVDVDKGITNASSFEVAMKKKLITKGNQIILIADYSKFGKVSMYKVTDLSSADIIITNKELDSSYIRKLRDTDIELVLV
jgi:DeoR/GlpR family transcriptional regulator of sugar metabolism